MKINIILFLLCLMIPTLYGQKISIGPEVGFVSSLSEDGGLFEIDYRRHTYYVGLNINYNLKNNLQLLTGIQYLQQGYKFLIGPENMLVGKFDYLVIPISFNRNLGKRNQFVAGIGIYVGYNLKAVQDYPERDQFGSVYYEPDLTELTNKSMFGASVNFGYKLYTDEKIELITQLKYYQGISNIASDPYGSGWSDKYSSILATVALNFKL